MDSKEIERYVQREQMARPGKVFAFMGLYMGGENPWHIRVAILGEHGHNRPVYETVFTEEADAVKLANALNKAMGLSIDTVMAIIADTMSRSQFKLQQEQGLTPVNLTQDEIKGLLDILDGGDGYEHLHGDTSDLLSKLEGSLY